MCSTVTRKTGSATLVIEKFSKHTDWKEVNFAIHDYSDNYFGFRPSAVLYDETYVFVYLQNFDATFEFRANVSILNSEDEKLFTKEYRGEFDDENAENLYILMPRSALLSPEKGYLHNDILTLLCEIEVIKSNISDTFRNDFNKLSENLQSLLTDDKFTDFTLVVGKDRKEFRVHKNILAVRSPVFAAMFEHDCEEKRQNKVNITDMDEEVCAEMLSYIYTGQVKGLDRYAMDLFLVADKYQLESLKTLCEQYFASNLAIESVVNVLIMADLYRSSDLKVNCFDYICDNATSVKATDGWKMLTSTKCQLFEELFDHLAKKYNK